MPAKVQYQVTEIYSFSSDHTEKKIKLAVMVPKDNAYQDVGTIEIKWDGDISREVYRDVDVIKMEGQSENNEAILEYEVTLFQGKVNWEGQARPQDLRPQKDIESDDPVLIDQAMELCTESQENAAYETYIFTSSYLSWPQRTRVGGAQSARNAYESRTGVCGEFANLMTALNRSCKNPARSISGLSMPLYLPPMLTKESMWMHPGGAHAWVECHHKSLWTIADPSWASRMPLDGLWFGRSLGQYLSYGETGEHEQIFARMMQWGEENGEVIGAMSAPIKFVSSSEDKNQVTITPVVRVKKLRDARWLLAISEYFVIIAASSTAEYLIGKKKFKTMG